MSKYALKILSICPRSLLDRTFIRLLGAERGLLLAEINGPTDKTTAGWNRVDFTDAEQAHLTDAYIYLKERRAIIDYKPTTDINDKEEEQTKVCRELLSEKTYLSLAICSDKLDLPDSVEDKFYSIEKALDDGKLVHKAIDVEPMKASILAKIMTPYAFDCSSFRLIDPFIYEINETNVFQRVDFLVELCAQIEEHNTLHRGEISIEVFGRCYRYLDGKKVEINPNGVKRALSYDSRLKALSEKGFKISFVGLDDRESSPELEEYSNDRIERLHSRLLMTDKYIFTLEWPFKTEPKVKNKIWFGTQFEREELDLAYRYRSSIFDGAFEFKMSDVRFREEVH